MKGSITDNGYFAAGGLSSPAQRLRTEVLTGARLRTTASPMRLVSAAPEVEYGGRTDNAVVELFVSHDFEDEQELTFSTHQYFVQFRDFDRNLDREKQTMSATYRALAALEKYDIFATLDLQVRADPHG